MYYAKDQTSAEDILQDGFVKIFEKISQLKDHNVLEAWMRRIFVNTALLKFRKENRLTYETEMATYEESLSYDEIIDAISARELMELIKELTPQYKVVFNLYAIEGYTHKEIAEELGISEGTSKSNLSRARTILQKKILEIKNSSAKIIKMSI